MHAVGQPVDPVAQACGPGLPVHCPGSRGVGSCRFGSRSSLAVRAGMQSGPRGTVCALCEQPGKWRPVVRVHQMSLPCSRRRTCHDLRHVHGGQPADEDLLHLPGGPWATAPGTRHCVFYTVRRRHQRHDPARPDRRRSHAAGTRTRLGRLPRPARRMGLRPLCRRLPGT